MNLDDANDEALDRVRDLVADALEAAGIQWRFSERLLEFAAAQITVDHGDDADRGVFVTWDRGLPAHEALYRPGAAPSALTLDAEMTAATGRLRSALRNAAIEAIDAKNPFDPYLLKVITAPD